MECDTILSSQTWLYCCITGSAKAVHLPTKVDSLDGIVIKRAALGSDHSMAVTGINILPHFIHVVLPFSCFVNKLVIYYFISLNVPFIFFTRWRWSLKLGRWAVRKIGSWPWVNSFGVSEKHQVLLGSYWSAIPFPSPAGKKEKKKEEIGISTSNDSVFVLLLLSLFFISFCLFLFLSPFCGFWSQKNFFFRISIKSHFLLKKMLDITSARMKIPRIILNKDV